MDNSRNSSRSIINFSKRLVATMLTLGLALSNSVLISGQALSTTAETSTELSTVGNNSGVNNGWIKDGGSRWYYCFTKEDASRENTEGTTATNQWVLTNGKWYYLNASGAMETNKWVLTNGKWYYLKDNGAMASHEIVKNKDGVYYAYVAMDGSWQYIVR